jgi:MFS transporter, PAT family, beta-lactamase induction signal transducer AmpG
MIDERSANNSPSQRSGSSAVSWWESITEYGHPRVVGMLFLGFSAGLPFLLVFSTLSAWLRDVGVSRTAIGFFAWIGITYSIKVIWSPLVDRLRLPFLTGFLGKRRSWMLAGQVGIGVGLLAMAFIDPTSDLALFAFVAFLVAFSSATQDVALDAYRIEAVESRYQGPMAANYQTGYRIGVLMAGAGALFIADIASFQVAYVSMALLMSIGIITVLLIEEPEIDVEASRQRDADLVAAITGFGGGKDQPGAMQKWMLGAVVNPFLDFFRRTGRWAFVILAFVAVYRIGDLVMGIMANPFYLDLGFTKTEIAAIAKVFGFAMTIIGAVTGGLLAARYSAVRMLVVGAVLVAGTNLLFAELAVMGADKTFLAVTISADNFSAGFAGSVFIAFLSGLTSATYTATQYALFSSLMTLPGKIISGYSGMIVDAYDYQWFFFYAAAMGVPAIILSLVMMWWSSKTNQKND